MMENLLNRFLEYVRFDTKSDESSSSTPSSAGQLIFAERLASELKEMGLTEVSLDSHGYVMASLPANITSPRPVIGFIAHMDTSPEAPSHNVNPIVHHNYDGGDILLSSGRKVRLSPEMFPELLRYRGQTIVTSDGKTLLGADDKAGVAEIMTAMEFLVKNPSLEHGKIRVAFTPDEEIGRGADHFNVTAFGADYAYTVDGGGLGELEYENFNAAAVTLTIRGISVHPGTARDKMINSIMAAKVFDSLLPEKERPEFTSGYEGFYHLYDLKGSVEETVMKYIVRDHDAEKFAARKKVMKSAASALRRKYRDARVRMTVRDQYFNMKRVIESNFFIIEEAVRAYRKADVEPVIRPVRGGTDGARLSFMGLPCPNLFTGGHNYHGRYEYIPLRSMQKAVEVIVNIATETGKS